MLIEESIHFNTIGHVVARNVPEEIYMRDYAENHCEWVDGTVIKMSPVHDKHDEITQYLITVFRAYFEKKPIAKLRHDPFVMRYNFESDGEIKRRNREPDIKIILNDNPNPLTPTYMDGAADICIEVVSRESIERDYAEKLHEYEQIGVQEYWIIDPLKKEARFYRLNENKAYVLQTSNQTYTSLVLPRLQINLAALWQDNLPGPSAIVQAITKMLED